MNTKQQKKKTNYWWKEERQQLLNIAQQKGPVYVYSKEEIRRNIKRIRRLKAIGQVFYAMKANANSEVLRQFYQAGLGFECVSIGEVERILELFPQIDRHRILFTPNFAPRSEYERGLKYRIHLTVDNMYPLRQWPEVFSGQSFFLRIDPGRGQGHHQHVKTGGSQSKFGIPRAKIPQLKPLLKNLDAQIKGLHAHAGSGIKDVEQWKDEACLLHEVAEELGGVKILDLGGGFGIRQHAADCGLNMQKVAQSLQNFKQACPEHTLWIEPGRFLAATAGVLLTTVTQLKQKDDVRFVGVETGMNSFIRPALYGANHTIANLSKLNQPARCKVNLVGPICESGDKLAVDCWLPPSDEGDIILIANTGAYGYVMESNYNLRVPAGEVVI